MKVRLPNGIRVRCHDRQEARLLYREVFEQLSYLKNGLEL